MLTLVFSVRPPNTKSEPRRCTTRIRVSSRSLLTSNTIITRILSGVKNLPSKFHDDKSELIRRISRAASRVPSGVREMCVSLRPHVDETKCDISCFFLYKNVSSPAPPSHAEEEEDQLCSICLEGLLDSEGTPSYKHDYLLKEQDVSYLEPTKIERINGCSHVFHRHCLSKWFKESVSCPLCRFQGPLVS